MEQKGANYSLVVDVCEPMSAEDQINQKSICHIQASCGRERFQVNKNQ